MENAELSTMQQEYKTAIEEWIAAIRAEEALASVEPTLAQVDRWEEAHFAEEAARNKAKQAKADYEAAIRKTFFNF
jgi:hypothetical protein